MHEFEQLDIQQVVEELRFFLQSSDRTSSDRLGILAQEYSRHCDEINLRLRRCQECLRKGLRSEAIHLAEAAPPLLDQVALLDFPERTEWEETTVAYGLQSVPGLLLDVAADLNEAYALEKPLEGLMRRHRLAALGRESLQVRLKIMRQIQQFDSESQVWAEDLRTFEKARFVQIESEAEAAATKGRSDVLKQLSEELSQTSWSVKPAVAVLRNVERLSTQTAQKEARKILEKLEPAINGACATLDVSLTRQLREAWEKNATVVGLKSTDPLSLRVQPALDWLSDEDRKTATEQEFQKAVQRLESALDGDGELSQPELERLGHSALKFDRPLPAALEARYRSRIHAVSVKESRRRRLIVYLAAGAIASAVVIVAGIMISAHRTEQVRLAVERVMKLAREQNLDEARREFDRAQADSSLASTPEFLELGIQLRSLEQKEKIRTEEFENLMKEAGSAPLEGSLPSPLAQARHLARTNDEKSRVDRLERERSRAQTEDRQLRESLTVKRVEDIGQRLSKIETLVETDGPTDDASRQLSTLAADVASLERDAKDLNARLRSQVSTIAGRFKTTVDRYERIRDQLDFEQRLADTARQIDSRDSSIQAYVSLIEKQIAKSPEAARSRDLKRALLDVEPLKAAVGWSELVQGWKSIREQSVGIAGKRLGDCQAFAKKHPNTPDAAVIREATRYWDAIVKRRDAAGAEASDDDESEGRGLRTRLRLVYADMLIANVWMVTTDAGKRFYSNQEFAFGTGDSVTVPYFIGFDGTYKRKNFFRKDVTGGKAVRAPQSVLADEVLSSLRTLEDSKWDEGVIQLLKRVRSDSDIDPLLKLILLRRTLDIGMRGSYPLQLEFKDYQQALEKSGVNLTVPWMDPESVSAPKARNDAKLFFATLNEPEVTSKTLEQRYERLSKRFLSAVRPAGCLFQTRKGTWIVRDAGPLHDKSVPGELMVVTLRNDGSVVWNPIGDLSRDSFQVSTSDPEALVEGRLVFLRPR